MSSQVKASVVLSRVQALDQLRSNLELTGLQERTVAARQKNVPAATENQLNVADTFLEAQSSLSATKQARKTVILTKPEPLSECRNPHLEITPTDLHHRKTLSSEPVPLDLVLFCQHVTVVDRTV